MALYNLSNPLQAKQAESYFEHLKSKGARVELTHKRKARTYSQNAYLHLILTAWGGHLGYTLEEMKHLVKSQLMPSLFEYERKGSTFYKSTASLDTKQMTHVIDTIRSKAQEHSGYYIPAPNEQEELQALANEAELYAITDFHD